MQSSVNKTWGNEKKKIKREEIIMRYMLSVSYQKTESQAGHMEQK